MEDPTLEPLILDLLEWVAARPRTYEETMNAWRTSCPRLPVWEEANDRGLLRKHKEESELMVVLTPTGARRLSAVSR